MDQHAAYGELHKLHINISILYTKQRKSVMKKLNLLKLGKSQKFLINTSILQSRKGKRQQVFHKNAWMVLTTAVASGDARVSYS